MNYGATIKTKAGPDAKKDEFFFIYDKPGGTHIGSAKESSVIGTYERTESKLLTDYAYVKLAIPVTYKGQRYLYAYIREAYVFAFTPTLITYYVKPAITLVNVRSSATTASSKNIIGSLKGNALVGTTDGTTANGFFRFTLPNGRIGWVSRNFITSTVPTGVTPPTIPTPDPAEPKDIPTDPVTDTKTQQAKTTVENAVSTRWLNTLKWVGIGLVALALGIALAKVYERRAVHPKN